MAFRGGKGPIVNDEVYMLGTREHTGIARASFSEIIQGFLDWSIWLVHSGVSENILFGLE